MSAHVDGQLTPEEATLAAAHVSACQACRALLERLQPFGEALRSRSWIRETPTATRQRVIQAIEAEAAGVPARFLERWRLRPRLQLALVAAVAVLVAVSATLLRRTTPAVGVLGAVASDFRAAESASLPLALTTDDPQELRQYYRQTGLFPFFNTVLDLEPLGYILVGGGVSELGAAKSTVTVYRSEHGWLVCHRIAANRDIQYPAGGTKVADGMVYTIDGITIWMHIDGDALCVMASALPPGEFMRQMLGHA